ncbi:MAG: diacylglycerol/lipid kinase family protein [Thermoplasmatota archaeon]
MKEEVRISCIFNPEAGRGRFRIGPSELEKMLKDKAREKNKELRLEMSVTERTGDAERIARKLSKKDTDTIVACGGDGTIYEAANGMVDSGKALGIIPIGSGNDTMTSINGGPRPMDDCISDIIRGIRHSVDVGMMNDRYFMNVVGVGMDAAINHEVAKRRGMVLRFGPTFQYFFCTFRVIPTWRDMEMLLTIDGTGEVKREIKMLTVGNGTTCGGGFRLTPLARMDDGLLDVGIINKAGTLRTLTSVPKAFKGKHLDLDLTDYRKMRSLKVRTEDDRELPYHIDGEKGFARSFEFQVFQGKMWTVHPLKGVN